MAEATTTKKEGKATGLDFEALGLWHSPQPAPTTAYPEKKLSEYKVVNYLINFHPT
jgi:hypothetical protein